MGSTFVLVAATGDVDEPVPAEISACEKPRQLKHEDRYVLDRMVDDGKFYTDCIRADSLVFRTCTDPCSRCDHETYYRPLAFERLRAISAPHRQPLIDYLERNPNLYIDCYW